MAKTGDVLKLELEMRCTYGSEDRSGRVHMCIVGGDLTGSDGERIASFGTPLKGGQQITFEGNTWSFHIRDLWNAFAKAIGKPDLVVGAEPAAV